jgi:Zn ribbon nucleic-acid-binding protein
MLSTGVPEDEDADKEAMEEEDSVDPLPVVECAAKTRKQRSVSRSRNGEKLVNKRETRAPR